MTDELRAEWDTFLNGHWQKEMPKKVGEYPLATLDGELGGRGLVYFAGGFRSVHTWRGWWWSEPIPDMPPLESLRKETSG